MSSTSYDISDDIYFNIRPKSEPEDYGKYLPVYLVYNVVVFSTYLAILIQKLAHCLYVCL